MFVVNLLYVNTTVTRTGIATTAVCSDRERTGVQTGLTWFA